LGQALLRLRGITKRFGELRANDRVDLDLARGEVLGLLGENGAGKTTLMSILFGHYLADAGTIEVADPDGELRPLPPGQPKAALAAGIGMVHQHFTLADNLSVLDNVLLGTEPLYRPLYHRGPARRRLEALMQQAGLTVPSTVPVRTLSVGERQRVEILKVLYRGARILILDEPTAVLTPQAAAELFTVLRRLAADGLGIIFISHKLGEVLAMCQRIAVLRAGQMVASLPTAGGNRAELAELMVGHPVPPTVRRPLEPSEPVLELEGVDVDDAQGQPLLRQVSLTIHGREILGVAGVAGNGQAGLGGLLSGLLPASGGSFRLVGEDARRWRPATFPERHVARIPEDRHRHAVVASMTVWENLALADRWSPRTQRFGWLRRRALRKWALGVMQAFDVRGPGPEATVRLLSGGNIQKLILGRELSREPDFILADQPSRGLDVGAVAEVHRRLLAARANGAAILLIDEDLEELLALADRVTVLYRGTASPPVPTEELDIPTLGLMMAGQKAEASLHAA
jgi:simple sugar transport system ATP-binding protein